MKVSANLNYDLVFTVFDTKSVLLGGEHNSSSLNSLTLLSNSSFVLCVLLKLLVFFLINSIRPGFSFEESKAETSLDCLITSISRFGFLVVRSLGSSGLMRSASLDFSSSHCSIISSNLLKFPSCLTVKPRAVLRFSLWLCIPASKGSKNNVLVLR